MNDNNLAWGILSGDCLITDWLVSGLFQGDQAGQSRVSGLHQGLWRCHTHGLCTEPSHQVHRLLAHHQETKTGKAAIFMSSLGIKAARFKECWLLSGLNSCFVTCQSQVNIVLRCPSITQSCRTVPTCHWHDVPVSNCLPFLSILADCTFFFLFWNRLRKTRPCLCVCVSVHLSFRRQPYLRNQWSNIYIWHSDCLLRECIKC